ncbi:MAG: DUF4093 domain-containing protein [Ruminococcaceae bacterium]|nr:DUF4093 domain-containing protein [Oscillospiraceae bacterium]
MKRIKLKYPLFVEGSYDKKRVCAVAQGTVITGGGFGIFNAKEKLALLRKITENGKLLILTDSDNAGRLIRNKLKGFLGAESIINIYTPALEGKERRKKAPSKEGLLGVEGMSDDVLYKLLLPYSADGEAKPTEDITAAELYNCGLVGCDGSEAKRKEFCLMASLPPSLSPKALREAVNILGGKTYFFEIMEKLK